MISKAVILLLAGLASGSAGAVQTVSGPAISQFGKITSLPNAAMQPDPKIKYRVAFNISKAPAEPDLVNAGLEKVARYMNLLAAGGVPPAEAEVVVVVHGPATELVLSNDSFRRRHGTDNPNRLLIEALSDAGVAVHVCGQALARQKIAHSEVLSKVTVDLAALVTLTTLQLKGWSVIDD